MPPTDPLWFHTLTAEERAELAACGTDELLRTPDVLVVGAGLVGLATAYFLAEQGARVQVIDAGPIAGGASGASAGGVWPNDQGPSHPPGFQALAFLSRDLWGRLSLRPGFDLDWRVNGFLNVNPERFPPSAPEFAARLQEQGYAVQPVDNAQIAALEPNLRPGVAAGLHYPSEAHLNPVKAALSLARAARRRGTAISRGVAAVAATVDSNRVRTVETTAVRIDAGQVVAATGWNGKWLGAAIPTPLPLRPVSGQLISTNRLPPLLNSAVAGRFLVLQLRTGEIITGGNMLESDRLEPDASLAEEFAAAARDLVPALSEVAFTRAWCGLRPATPDGLPIIDRAAAAENLWLACGHHRNGVLLAPATGKLLANWITTGTRDEILAPFALPSRSAFPG